MSHSERPDSGSGGIGPIVGIGPICRRPRYGLYLGIMLHAQTLFCRRGGHVVFRDITFTLEPGALLQVTGANGSGKSSLLRILAGFVRATAGSLMWQNENIDADVSAHHGRVHYIGHLDALKLELSVAEMLDYWCALRAISAPASSDPFALAPHADELVRYLSAGLRRRLTLTRLVLDDAPLWLLDEPATALDANSQELLATLITGHRAKGGIAVIATHHDLLLPTTQYLTMPAQAA
jgi:heme exporter protein A